MDILFLDNGNVGRSQMAAAMYEEYGPRHAAARSAVLRVASAEGGRLHPYVIQVMQEKGIDVSENTRSQLREEMLQLASYVVLIAEGKETELFDSERANEIWHVPNPKGTSLAFHREVRDDIA